MDANEVFNQNDGDVTKAYYKDMNAIGPMGELAVALFRAQKRSTAAKRYRRGKFRHLAYDVKNWSLSEICRVLIEHTIDLKWGWKRDPATPGFEWVLYVDLPNGQVSFHSANRLQGPDYEGMFDGAYTSQKRICEFCNSIAHTYAHQ